MLLSIQKKYILIFFLFLHENIYCGYSLKVPQGGTSNEFPQNDNDESFRFNDASTHEGHLHQDGVLTWFCNEMAKMISYICMKM